MMSSAIKTGYHSVVGLGICPHCNVLYKLRAGEQRSDGVYICRECGAKIQLKPAKNASNF